jgi:hypothetical protein
MFTLPGVSRYFSHMKKTESKNGNFDLGASRKFMRGAPTNSEQEKALTATLNAVAEYHREKSMPFPSLLQSEENKRRHALNS